MYQLAELTTPLPRLGAKPGLTELCHMLVPVRPMAKHRESVYQPAEKLVVVSAPMQSTNMWLMGNAYFMSEQMAFLQLVSISIQENGLLVTKAPAITNMVFSA